MSAHSDTYFVRDGATSFRAMPMVGGAWKTDEQHIAPALGLLAHTLEQNHWTRRSDVLLFVRASFGIVGTFPLSTAQVETRVVRPGRTVELVEASLRDDGRASVIARTWFLSRADTTDMAGTGFPEMPPRSDMSRWVPADVWPSAFIENVDSFKEGVNPGRARTWVRSRMRLLPDEPIRAASRLLALVDIVNGVAPRKDLRELGFPNVDITAYLFRAPESDWIDFGATVGFGSAGHGLSYSIIHDEHGRIGAVSQSLMLRRRMISSADVFE